MGKKCFLCNSGDSLIDFTDETFRNCSLKLAFRRKKNFKYNEVELNEASLDFVGYHTKCYKKVTVLGNKYNEEFTMFCMENTEPVNASVADEGPKILHSSAHSDSTVIKVEEGNFDDMSQISADLNEEPSTSKAPTCNKITCVFCNYRYKRCGKQQQNVIFPQSDKTTEKLKNMAEKFGDVEVLSKLENQTVAYHQSCYAVYQTKEKRSTEEHVDSSWHKYRHVHKLAFDSIKDFVTREIVGNNKVMYFAKLFRRYQALLLEFGDHDIDFDDIQNYRPETLEKKLRQTFHDRIIIEASTGPRNQKIIYKADIDILVMENITKFLDTKDEEKLEDVAYNLRNCIKNIDSHPLPKHLTADDINRGECEIPQRLLNFMQNLILGPNAQEINNNQTMTKITSICSDIIYAVMRGKCKPAKNLTLGLAMKSLTNSRQVLTMLNRYGHTIDYHLAEELETEMTYTAVGNNILIPTGITAFDNFDRFVDTTSGKDTMHDTVGIINQFPSSTADFINIEATTSSAPQDNVNEDEQGSSCKRRRFNEIS
ncbi:hypothetical protein PV328_007112 [Microctonus aethiopoides]|uniref:Uncharacterized protein n=1 Tax=Microctonus aethiopoides TaxID=144406 RepID=A0AA39FQJ6_9HYME|nr:hypothetical protein PV328_007112 [Microctonus aethiopoides]